MKLIQKYLRIYRSFLRTSLIAEMEFRANFIIRIIADIVWYVGNIAVFEVLYLHVNSIGGWGIEQIRVFLGLIFIVDGFYMVFLSENLDHLSSKVRKGELDLLLAKPVNSQFMISLQRVILIQAFCLLIGIAYFTYAILQLPDLQWQRLLWLILLIPCGVISTYAVRFIFSASAVIFTQSDNLQYLWYSVYKLGLRPDTIYVKWIRFFIMSLIPVAFVASVPAHAIFSTTNWMMLGWVFFWTAFLLWFSNWFWNFALKFYTSASS